MGAGFAGNSCSGTGDLFVVRVECAAGTAGRERDWTFFWRGGVRVYDFCGVAGSAKTCTDMAAGARESLDERTFVAWAAGAANDFVSWGI